MKKSLVVFSFVSIIAIASCATFNPPKYPSSSQNSFHSRTSKNESTEENSSLFSIDESLSESNVPSSSQEQGAILPSSSEYNEPFIQSSSSQTAPSSSSIILSSSQSQVASSSSASVSNSDSVTFTSESAKPYYSGINWSSKGSTLKTNLYNLISKGTVSVGYSGLWNAYKTTDTDSSGSIEDVYSNYRWTVGQKQCGSYKNEGECWNREHTIPQSVFSESSPMVCDIHHVFPTDGKVNGMRSNYPHGYVKSATYTSGNGSKLGSGNSAWGYSSTCFEPIDKYKGDFARTYFYFVTRYQNLMSSNTSWKSYDCFNYSSSLGLSSWAIKTFLEWSRLDPVSDKEIRRNEEIYKIQKNRNPFVDVPEAAEMVFGS